MNRLKEFKKLSLDYLTFYHEVRIPENDYFTGEKNTEKERELLVISSPSRMGNHAILSMLDNHPELPRIPGEDGFLSHCFTEANYDLNKFLTVIKSPAAVKFCKFASANGSFDKWDKFKKSFLADKFPEKHSGIDTSVNPAIMDYKDMLFDIDYDSYSNELEKLSKEDNAASFKDLFNTYCDALIKLDYQNTSSNYDGFIIWSGMRVQILWLCQYFDKVKILASIRPFDSYAISHIRSRYGEVELSDKLVQEAWEHWYHKVIDYLFIKVNYPDKLGLIAFNDLFDDTERLAESIAEFLNVKFDDNMLHASIFGNLVKGNPSSEKTGAEAGSFYKSTKLLPENKIPEIANEILDNLALIKL